jgi:ABC-type lipoprotein release transport system permease subunit
MLIIIAWRNIWRNRLRSIVVILSIAIGLWAGVFTMALMNGMTDQRTRGTIKTFISHVQVHTPAYVADPDERYYIEDPQRIYTVLDTLTGVLAYSPRMRVGGMSSSPTGGTGVMIYGIDPDVERQVTDINSRVTIGSYFDSEYRNPIVVGEKLAEKLGVRERSKIVLTFQAENGDLTAGAFRIVGLYKTDNSVLDETNVFVKQESIERLYGGLRIHEVAVFANTLADSEPIRDTLNRAVQDIEARYWGQVSPELGYTADVLDQSLYIFVLVILLAMAFGIVNSMLMAVLERRHELGMLLCIGMSKGRIFAMIVLETIFVTSVGGPLGLIMASGSVAFFGSHGIDLSVVGEGLQSMGMATVVYPALGLTYYINITLMVVITALISALYPAKKAIAYPPAEAVRTL